MAGAKAKKKAEGAPTWMVTFADLMSLLLTFFVLLLSFSNMEIDKFKKIAGAMRDSFGMQRTERKAGVIELDGTAVATANKHVIPIPDPTEITSEKVAPEMEQAEEAEDNPTQTVVPEDEAEKAKRTFNDLQTVMASEIASDVMDLIRAGNLTVVRFPDKVSFPSGSGELKPEFIPVLDKFIKALADTDSQIIISGHTDDVPITTEHFRSNWDLSAHRAGSVAHYILQHSAITSSRITVQGYADSRPLAPNDNDENRAKNRRVEVTIESVKAGDGAAEAGLDTQAGANSGVRAVRPPSIIRDQ